MKRSIFLLLVCSLALLACQQKSEEPQAQIINEPERLNILWIVSEDDSPWLGSYGDEVATTPRLDALEAKAFVTRVPTAMHPCVHLHDRH